MFVLASIVLVTSCSKNKKQATVEEKPIAVTTAEVQSKNLAIKIDYTGTLEGLKEAKIYSSIPEAVVDLPISQGSVVEAGQAIILLDKNGPTSRFRQSEAAYLEAKDNYEKMGKLFEQGAISQQTYNGIRTAFEIAEANYKSARQQVELTSPIAGVLTDLSVNVGQYAPLGIPLATVAQTDRIRLKIYVDSRGATYIRSGQKATVSVNIRGDSLPQFDAIVTDVAKSADPQTRLFKVELQIDNKDRQLRPGMFAKATINVAELSNVLVVPREAVFLVEGVAKVYKLDGNRAREQTVTLGETTSGYYQVTSGLTAGETVIVLGRSQVEDGALIKIVSDTTSMTKADTPKGN
jgi:RND family efflux transporter MFP subunit